MRIIADTIGLVKSQVHSHRRHIVGLAAGRLQSGSRLDILASRHRYPECRRPWRTVQAISHRPLAFRRPTQTSHACTGSEPCGRLLFRNPRHPLLQRIERQPRCSRHIQATTVLHLVVGWVWRLALVRGLRRREMGCPRNVEGFAREERREWAWRHTGELDRADVHSDGDDCRFRAGGGGSWYQGWRGGRCCGGRV